MRRWLVYRVTSFGALHYVYVNLVCFITNVTIIVCLFVIDFLLMALLFPMHQLWSPKTLLLIKDAMYILCVIHLQVTISNKKEFFVFVFCDVFLFSYRDFLRANFGLVKPLY